MRRIGIIAVMAMAVGCDSRPQSPSASRPATATGAAPGSIGPQFWKYDLKEYSIVAHDKASGPGGRWISVRYQRHPNERTTREEVVSRIAAALQADGWRNEPLPPQRYVFSKIWETSSEDQRFTRPAKPDEPAHWFFAQTVFVSKEADTLAIYCEVGW